MKQKMKHYITNDLISHLEMLGSQTFNYFTLYAIAKKTGHEVAISTAPHRFQGIVTECFDTPFSFFPYNESFEIFNSTQCTIPILEENLYKLDIEKNHIINARFDYGCIYWSNLLQELAQIFKIKEKYINDAKFILSEFNKPIVCLNFRRGDYPFYMDNYMEYYAKALEQTPQDSLIVILSNDFDWVDSSPELKKLLKNKKNILRANFLDYVQLAIITLSDYNICCPSSFCILGSILNKKNNVMMFPYLHDKELLTQAKAFQFMVDIAFPNCIQIKF